MSRRLAQLRVSPEILIEACKERFPEQPYRIVRNALPEDARFHHAYHEPTKASVFLVLESEEFAEIVEGGAIPFLPEPILERVNERDGKER